MMNLRQGFNRALLPVEYLARRSGVVRSVAGRYFDSKDKSRLMLVPRDAKEPKVFQVKARIENCYYIDGLADFYGPPNRQ
jgi:hypothetical protein